MITSEINLTQLRADLDEALFNFLGSHIPGVTTSIQEVNGNIVYKVNLEE